MYMSANYTKIFCDMNKRRQTSWLLHSQKQSVRWSQECALFLVQNPQQQFEHGFL